MYFSVHSKSNQKWNFGQDESINFIEFFKHPSSDPVVETIWVGRNF